jgi:hypothetical protein
MILITSCKKDDPYKFTVYINNTTDSESGVNSVSCLTFQVLIDGNRKFSDEICETPDLGIFYAAIEPGPHRLQAEAAGVAGRLDTIVYIPRSKKYCYLNYRSNTQSFDFYFSTSGGIDK